MDAFRIADPLPRPGITVLEASAGTGKTFTLASLATRYVAEGVADLDDLLLITFSRAATRELRDRVRDTFVETAGALLDPGAAPEHSLAQIVATGPDGSRLAAEEVARRRQRLLDAVAHYDSATIATTHEFCHAVLRSLGVAGSSDPREQLRQDITLLTDEVVADTYLRLWADEPTPPITAKQAAAAVRAALGDVHAELRPLGLDPTAPDGATVAFAQAVRAEVERRKKRGAIFTFDDMLSRLRDSVRAADSAAAERMRARWRVVLVDEFQDTDPVQWAVLEGAFADACTLVLIGDPKQAIYAFRGGDTPTYLDAVTGARTATLDTNHRSDAVVVDALQVMLRGAHLGDPRIEVHAVSPARTDPSLLGPDGEPAGGVRLRRIPRGTFDLTKGGHIRAGDWRRTVARDVASDIARQLTSGLSVTTPDGETRPLEAGDIAVLLPSVRRDGPAIQAELTRLGIPWVVNTADSVMRGPAAQHWLRLLEAMEQPAHQRRLRAAALTPLLGATVEELDAGGEERVETYAERVRSWLDLWRSKGIAAVLAASRATGLAARTLRLQEGERLLTDLTHIGELLHVAAAQDNLGLAGLTRWLRDAIAEGNRTDSRRRRLDVDAQAVQFATIHGSKGLEYPLVHLPALFDRRVDDWSTAFAYHEGDGTRVLDLVGTEEARDRARRESAEEDLRLAYVAMTRARSQLTLWWAPTWNGGNAALTRLLFGRLPGEAHVPARATFGVTDAETDTRLRTWADAGAFVLEDAVPAMVEPLSLQAPAVFTARTFDRELDTAWRRTSYSGLIRAEEAQALDPVDEPEDAGTVDESAPDAPLDLAVTPTIETIDPELLSPLDGLPAGADFGSLVHAVLEHADPSAPDLEAELLARVEEQRRWWPVAASSERLAAGLRPLNHTPLGPLTGGRTLADIPLNDRLRELDFEIPLADGDRGSTPGRALGEVADLLRRHLPADDPVHAYAARLDNPSLGEQVLRGYLSGSIDAVLRVEVDGIHRFVVVDYKTNSLGEPGLPLTALDYTPDKVAAAMVHSHYPLQALLYSVVLHRFLRWRLPDYDPATHLGGVLYLYVRGMVGEHTPVIDGVPCGVFSWTPPTPLVLDLSDLLDGRGAGT